MNILVSCLSKSWGGMEMFVISSIKLLLKEGHAVILAAIKNSPIDKESRALPVEWIRFHESSLSLKSVMLFEKVFKNRKIDLIHTHFSKDLWLIVPAVKFLGFNTPVVMTKHIGSAIEKKDPLHNFIYKRLNCAIAISEVIRQNLLDTTVLDEKKVALVHNFIDINKFERKGCPEDLKNEFGITPSQTVIGMVGRISPGKGHEDVIEAVRILSCDRPDIKVIIVGTSQENERHYEEGLKEKVRHYGLGEYITFTGFRKDIPELLSLFDIFLFPSHAEAFGLSLLEAMASGLPSIVCFSDGVKDIALENVTSLTYGRGEFEKLAVHIKSLISDTALRRELAKNSLERVKLFSPECFQEEIEHLYSDLTAEKKPKK